MIGAVALSTFIHLCNHHHHPSPELFYLEKLKLGFLEDGGEIGGSGVHFPLTPVKHLTDLRNRANSQRYYSIYEDRRPKIEDIEDLTGRRVLKDNKVPGTSTGTRAAEAPSRGTGSAAGFLGESQAGLCERPGACLDWGGGG